MEQADVVRNEPGRVVIELPGGPISFPDPELLGNFCALLAAFAFAALIGLLGSAVSRDGSAKPTHGPIGVPASLLFAAVFALVMATFEAYSASAATGEADYVPFAADMLFMGHCLVLGYVLAFLAVSWLFVIFDILTPYARAARLVMQALFFWSAWFWLNNTAMTYLASGIPLSGSKYFSFLVFANIIALLAIYVVASVCRFLLKKLRKQPLQESLLELIPALVVISAGVTLYIALGDTLVAYLWRVVLQAERTREFGVAGWMILFNLPVYLSLIMCQVAVPAIPRQPKK